MPRMIRYLIGVIVFNVFVLTYLLLFDSISGTLSSFFSYYYLNDAIISPDSVGQIVVKPGPASTCKLPDFQPNHESILHLVQHPRETLCQKIQPELTYMDETGNVRFNKTEMENFGRNEIQCYYHYFDRGDFEKEIRFEDSMPIDLMNQTVEDLVLPVEKTYMQINCFKSANNSTLVYTNLHTYPVREWEIINLKARRDLPIYEDRLSVLMFALESTSMEMMYRHLPQTIDYLTNKMNAIRFDMFLKVGENTLPNIVPMFTGLRQRAEEWNEMKQEISPDREGFFDHYPMIWKKFKEQGYITSFVEDMTQIGTFQYSGNGFVEKPVDLFYYPFWEILRTVKFPNERKSNRFCFGNKPIPRVFFDIIKHTAGKFGNESRPHFTFSIFSELTHDYTDDLERADNDLKEMFEYLFEKNRLNKTVLLFLGDHGPRFSTIRSTVSGYVEERHAGLFVYMPQWFYKKYPKIHSALKVNARRLVSPFDLHETLLDIANKNFRGRSNGSSNLIGGQNRSSSSLSFDSDNNGNVVRLSSLKSKKSRGRRIMSPFATNRGQSLLYPIPHNRTCKEAGVPVYYCLCDKIVELDTSSSMAQNLARKMVRFINEFNAPRRNVCHTLTLHKILYFLEILPPATSTANQNSLSESNNQSSSSYSSASTNQKRQRTLIIGFSTNPEPMAVFESFLTTDASTEEIFQNRSRHERTNSYWPGMRCTKKNYYHAKFCTCKPRPSKKTTARKPVTFKIDAPTTQWTARKLGKYSFTNENSPFSSSNAISRSSVPIIFQPKGKTTPKKLYDHLTSGSFLLKRTSNDIKAT